MSLIGARSADDPSPAAVARVTAQLGRLDAFSFWVVPTGAKTRGDLVVVGATGAFLIETCALAGRLDYGRRAPTVGDLVIPGLLRLKKAAKGVTSTLGRASVFVDTEPVVCLTEAVVSAPTTSKAVTILHLRDLRLAHLEPSARARARTSAAGRACPGDDDRGRPQAPLHRGLRRGSTRRAPASTATRVGWSGAVPLLGMGRFQDPLGPDIAASDLLEELSDEVLMGGEADDALRRLLRRGMRGRFSGLDALRRRLQQRRDEEEAQLNLAGPLEEIRQRLDEILERERTELSFRDDDDGRGSVSRSSTPSLATRPGGSGSSRTTGSWIRAPRRLSTSCSRRSGSR